MAHSRLRIGILLSGRGRGSNMQAIIDACRRGDVPGEVVRVVSTTEGTPALERARAAGIDTLFVDPAEPAAINRDGQDEQDKRTGSPLIESDTLNREPRAVSLSHPVHPGPVPCEMNPEDSLDHRLLAAFQEVGADTIALAGFMRRLGPRFLAAYPQRILNIHAALLPCFGGKGFYGRRVHEAVLESGARFSGATVHFVDELYDHGPIILQAIVPVEDEDTPDTLAARVLEQEHRIYPEALRLLAAGRLDIRGRRVHIKG